MELQDHTGSGGFFGLEIDALTTGASPFPDPKTVTESDWGSFLPCRTHGPKATIDYGVFVAPIGLRGPRPM
jgi:hypothetical protein